MANLNTPTRRGLLGAMAVIPIVGLAAIPAKASSSEWDCAYANVRALDNALDRASDVEEAARCQWLDACEPIQPKMLEDRPWVPLHAQLHSTPLDQIAALYEPPFVHAFGDGQAVADAVASYRLERDRLAGTFRIDETEALTAQAGNAWRVAFDEAIDTPVSTPRALAQKIELLATSGATDDQMGTLLRDAKRVSGEC